ncbi:hypothetical protein AVEN_38900-1 [Araneus ventricosus]|uniref:Reverse transcriptase domain-containing protein n=1 Tax=Araneus ventricosus TaxID=182803 RepID=A0A4Y2RCU0_ARAVE|nr:hypothetical protein AVEN_38900-1 [Araneus ventricosus]
MVNARLIYELEKQGCILPLQSGFRRGRSTVDNLVLLETQIRNAFVKRNHLVSIFFDIEKAYDRAWRYGILSKLFNFGFRGNLPIFLKNFLSYRTFRVRMGNFYPDHFIQAEGVPQGSVLSVTLFIVHLSQILNHLPSSVHGSLYVDDLQISCQGSNMPLIERQLQNAVNKLVAWCDNNGHAISPEKSSLQNIMGCRWNLPTPYLPSSDSLPYRLRMSGVWLRSFYCLEATGSNPSLCLTDLHWSLSYFPSGEPVHYFPPTTA